MAMRDIFLILHELGGVATIKQIRDLAKKKGVKSTTIPSDLHTLRTWRMVSSSTLRPGQKYENITWTIIGTREWNVIE